MKYISFLLFSLSQRTFNRKSVDFCVRGQRAFDAMRADLFVFGCPDFIPKCYSI